MLDRSGYVAPHTGAWIEILGDGKIKLTTASLPIRERGLKYQHIRLRTRGEAVAPHTGAWIEISEIILT